MKLSIVGHNNYYIWGTDGYPRTRLSLDNGMHYGSPLVGETFIEFADFSEIPAEPGSTVEAEATTVHFTITVDRVRFVAPCDMTFADLSYICYFMSGEKPTHAHIMEPGGVGAPAHVYFWSWVDEDTRSVMRNIPSWETGELALWKDVACSAGDSVSLDLT